MRDALTAPVISHQLNPMSDTNMSRINDIRFAANNGQMPLSNGVERTSRERYSDTYAIRLIVMS
jgi:hypothetical protein